VRTVLLMLLKCCLSLFGVMRHLFFHTCELVADGRYDVSLSH